MKRSKLAALIGMVLALLCAAPTVGDVGGCGAQSTDLAEDTYVRARKIVDCRRCAECAFSTQRCIRACDQSATSDLDLPATCKPLKRDGEVCLRALKDASCDDYAGYVADEAPTVPSECAYCRGAAIAP